MGVEMKHGISVTVRRVAFTIRTCQMSCMRLEWICVHGSRIMHSVEYPYGMFGWATRISCSVGDFLRLIVRAAYELQGPVDP